MAVTGLGLSLTDYREFACDELYGGTLGYAGLDTAEQSEVNRLILRGERTFWLHPPGVSPPHVWSCLRDPGLLDLWGDVATSAANTVSAATASTAGATICTANIASFTEADVGKTLVLNSVSFTVATYVSSTVVTLNATSTHSNKTFTIDGNTILKSTAASFYETMVGKTIVVTTPVSYVVSSYHGSTSIRVVGSAISISAKTFSIASDGTFPLPGDFESPEASGLTFTSQSWVPDIALMNERYVTGLRATQAQTGYPQYAAIRWLTSDGSAAQSQELVVWPEPDQHYEVSLPYMAQPQGMTITTNPYPRGGPEMADCLLAVILAICQESKTGQRGDRWASAAAMCAAAAQRDRTRHHNFNAGFMRSDSGSQNRYFDVKRLVLPA